MDDLKDKLFGSIFGVAVGDALGVPAEFSSREELQEHPVEDMEGYGAHNQPPGTWSDDTSLTLCLIDSLIHGYDLNDIAQKFVAWYTNGLWTPHGYAFDRGQTTRFAIENLMEGVPPTESGGRDEMDNGNGSLMRIAPLIFYTAKMDMSKRFRIVHEISSITHAHPRSLVACDFYVQYGTHLLAGMDKKEAYYRTVEEIKEFHSGDDIFARELKHFSRILENEVWNLKNEDINSHGYVVSTLEASLWSFINTSNFKDAVLKGVNLGHDTDTIGAVTGGLAGLYYGYSAIPEKWLNTLAKKDEIERLLTQFYADIKK